MISRAPTSSLVNELESVQVELKPLLIAKDPNLTHVACTDQMKTVLTDGPRLGIISEISLLPNVTFETPMLMQYTKAGSIPYMSNDIVSNAFNDQHHHLLQIPLANTIQFKRPLLSDQSSISIAEFIGMKQCATLLTTNDIAEAQPDGQTEKNSVPLWTRAGKINVNAQEYMKIVKGFQPDIYTVLSDTNTTKKSTHKRINKCVERTLYFFNECLKIHKNNMEDYRHCGLIACVEGGYSLEARKKCISAMINEPLIQGFVINGLHNNGPKVELLEFQDIEDIVKPLINMLPKDKFRIVPSSWNPVVVLHLIDLGYDLFDTSYLYLLVERSSALTFSFDRNGCNSKTTEFEINLKDYSKYIEDYRPLMSSCECFTCRTYTRAYLSHLVHCSELTAPILLNIHNVYHYSKFFEEIRKSIHENRFVELKQRITFQYNIYRKKISQSIT